jgi:hypothetical protein
MQIQRDDPSTWLYKPTIIAHDVGRSRDRSTAVVGGLCPLVGPLIGMERFIELPLKFYGTDRVEALAAIDREYNSTALIVADLSNDASYGEIFAKRFGPRAIGLNIGRSGDGMTWERRSFSGGSIPVYNVGRTFLLEHFHNRLVSREIRFVHGPEAQQAYQQLANLNLELRETGKTYTCPPGQHDDLGISCAMLAFIARHPHLAHYVRTLEQLFAPPVRPRLTARQAWPGST